MIYKYMSIHMCVLEDCITKEFFFNPHYATEQIHNQTKHKLFFFYYLMVCSAGLNLLTICYASIAVLPPHYS